MLKKYYIEKSHFMFSTVEIVPKILINLNFMIAKAVKKEE